jgi:hypothetical protein
LLPSEEELSEPSPRRVELLTLLPYTVVAHALLPLLIGWVGHVNEGALVVLLTVIHVGVPVVLVVTWPHWKGQGGEMILLIGINHFVTFAVGIGLLMALG